jgi:hypothetical protein
MGKTLGVMLLGWVMVHTVPVYAEGNGHDLLRQCTQAVNAIGSDAQPDTVNYMDAGQCMGLIDGFAGAAAFYESKSGSPRAICFPPDGMTIGQSVRMVRQYLEDHPEQLHESATVLIFGAFLANYPCK